jgi:hypothetical protein
MSKIYMDYKNAEHGDYTDCNLTRKELQAWGTKIIADARPKKKITKRISNKKLISRKEYIENMAMREKWWKHYGRHSWY